MRTWLILAILASVALAGCSGDDNDDEMDNTDDTPEPEPERELPDTLSFSWGPGLGCTGDLPVSTCISLAQGPGNDLDGVWVELGEDYEGLSFTTTVGNVVGDSDCEFTDGSGAVIGNANQGQGPCAGQVPKGTAWMHLYSYAEPHTGMTLTFTE